MQKDKVRIYILARELDIESKDLVDFCRQQGFDVKNQLSSLEPEQRDQVVALVKKGAHKAPAPASTGGATKAAAPGAKIPTLVAAKPPTLTAKPAATKPASIPAATGTKPAALPEPEPEVVATPEVSAPAATLPAPAPPPPPAPVVEKPPVPTKTATPAKPTNQPKSMPNLNSPPTSRVTTPVVTPPAVSAPAASLVASTNLVPPQKPTQTTTKTAPTTVVTAPTTEPSAPTTSTQTAPTAPPKPAVTPTATPSAPAAPTTSTTQTTPVAPVAPAETSPARSVLTPATTKPLPNLAGTKPPSLGGSGVRTTRNRVIPKPQIAKIAPAPTPKIKQAEPPKPASTANHPQKLMDLPADVMSGQRHIRTVAELIRENQQANKPPETPPAAEEDSDDPRKKRPAVVVGRDARHKDRAERQKLRLVEKGREHEVTSTRLLLEDEDDRHHRGPKRLLKDRLKDRQKQQAPKAKKAQLTPPITVRMICESIGIRAGDVLRKLMDPAFGMSAMPNINSTIDPEIAQLIGAEYGFEVEIKKQQTAEEEMIETSDKPDRPEELEPRAPIVTIMGHVDHGKTSLLDRIRKSNVVATEAGGITQVIRAWRVMHNGKPITFLDTPGHEAFTKMRARGANVTDIAVIVVAADDGVMPQTEEAISHAKAAGVSIVVAINKVDVPNANLRKAEQQLYGLGLIPDTMGGEVPFVHTSATKGTGIDELLEQLSVVAELKELRANPKKPGRGTVLEAMLSEGEGVFATLLVREGTLKRGDVVVCGAAFGRVRAMYDDAGNPLQEAGPSVPVRITGLDDVPNADDPFQVVYELSTAREVAEKRKERLTEAALHVRIPLTLEKLSVTKVAELKVVLKADFRGSVEAIRKELEKLYHDEVRVRVLHAAIGGITESDVQLALASPQDTIVVGFNVVPDNKALALAEERGIQIREYDIIYKLTDDIRAALEGKLKPREEIIHLGRALVRGIFKISRVGTIAGCYVTQGTIERSAKVRIIREGVVIYPPSDRTVGLDSLKRFKEDTKEVREGFECGIKVAGYDDVKVGDVIEAFRVEHVQRTL